VTCCTIDALEELVGQFDEGKGGQQGVRAGLVLWPDALDLQDTKAT
jgi:hypothetical protein